MYAKIKSGKVIAYPYTDRQLRSDNSPQVSFGNEITDEDRAEFGMIPTVTETPEFNPEHTICTMNPYEAWVVTDVATATYTLTDRNVDDRKEELLSRLAAKRWEVETGGIKINGSSIRTDEVGQGKITGALALMDKAPGLSSIDWEGQPGVWVTLDKATLEAIGVAVGMHVQACFSRARVISEAIQEASNHDELDDAQAEIETGWPQ